MGSSFGALNVALTALYAQKRGLDVTGQNIANANTEGYSRQRVAMRAMGAPPVPALYSRTDDGSGGVEISGVTRLQDALLLSRSRVEHAQDTYLTGVNDTYTQIQHVFSEPSDTGLQSQLGQMWSTFHDVANNPGDLATRNALLQQAQVVASGLNAAHTNLAKIWTISRQTLDSRLVDVNTVADTVAQLNKAIRSAHNAGLPDNSLVDQRDAAIMQLSEATGATTIDRSDGTTDVYLSGSILVGGDTARHLQAAGSLRLEDEGINPVVVQWTDSLNTATVTGGQVAADMQALSTILTGQSAAIDLVATGLITAVNTQHTAGFDLDGNAGTALFAGTGAADISVIITDPRLVAASSSAGGNLNGANATALANLATDVNGPDSVYRQMIAGLGVTAQSAGRRMSIQDGVKQQVDGALSAQSGVNLDEEMTNMLTFQRAYEAAARVMSVIDSSLDTLINKIGLG